jgi:hypothetical protein
MHSLLERIDGAHKGIRSKAAAGYFSFSYFLYVDAKNGVKGAETGSNTSRLWSTASGSFGLSL